MAIEGEGGAFHAKGASLRLDRPFVALKLNGNFPGNGDRHGLPTVQGAILFCDGETGRLLAVMDSIEITLRRTAAASALAAQLLARPESRALLICGCGPQGAATLEAIADVLPIERCFAWDIDPARSRRFAALFDGVGSLSVEAVAAPAEAAGEADVIVTCTTATTPFLDASMVGPGTFIAAVGADSPTKSEIAPDLMAGALVVADLVSQCLVMGDLHHAVAAGVVESTEIHAELHELLLGAKPGRTCDEQILLFDSTGTAVQDVAACAWIYERARVAGGLLSIGLGDA
jgi:ornithine cyclodeaminase/alanine dehydrogenase-like protein (mu-crystallin family)